MSRKKRDYIFFIQDIKESIEKIEKWTSKISFKEFKKNEILIDAVIRNLEIIGEAARNVPPEIKEKYKDVEWKEAIGFRNILTHDYFGVDKEAVWDTIRNDLPLLKKHIRELYNSEK
ncbi:MAG: DUF86 domain-containing protein [Ignavibacteria bacterium]|nr:DUF86 domain-containing protein [Ignavibacteria bacterium]